MILVSLICPKQTWILKSHTRLMNPPSLSANANTLVAPESSCHLLLCAGVFFLPSVSSKSKLTVLPAWTECWELNSCTCRSVMLMFLHPRSYLYVCLLSKCNPVCSALVAAINVCTFVKSVNATLVQGAKVIFFTSAKMLYTFQMTGCVPEQLHTRGLYSVMLCAIAVLVMSCRADSHTVRMSMLFCALYHCC